MLEILDVAVMGSVVHSVAVYSSSVLGHCVHGVAAFDPTSGESTTFQLTAVRTVWRSGVARAVL